MVRSYLVKKFSRILDEQQKKRIVPLFFSMIIGAAFEVVGVSLMVPLVTSVTTPEIIENNSAIKKICDIMHIGTYKSFVLACIFALIGIYVVKNVFLIFQNKLQANFVYGNRFATQQKLLHAFLSRDYEYYLNASSGEIIRAVQNDVSQAYRLFLNVLIMLSDLVVSFALVITILVIDWQMTLFVAAMLSLIMLIIVKLVRPKLVAAGLSNQKNVARTNGILLQSIQGIKEIKVFSKEDFFENNYENSGARVIESEKLQSVLQIIPKMLIEMMSVCSMLAVFAIEIMLGKEVDSLLPALGAFAMAAVKLMPSANRIVTSFNLISYSQPALDKLLDNLEVLRAEKPLPAEHSVNPSESIKKNISESIRLSNISYCYPNTGKIVLEDATMEIPIGKSIGIVGPSGEGKTTAVDVILGLLKPQKGAVLADGEDVSSFCREWLSHIGYIPQSIFMMDASIKSNVAFGVAEEDIDEGRVWECLGMAHMEEFVKELPQGLDTFIGERGLRISGGQMQRIGIARALYGNPDILIFDEATSSLDNDTELAVMDAVNSLHGKKTMIIIAHRLQTISGCDMVYRVENGKILREK